MTDACTTISRRGVNGASSVYQRLAAKLRRTITDKALAPGALVASEHELARREGISRKSVRRAVDVLIREGLAERRPGKGLYVPEKARAASTAAAAGPVAQIVTPLFKGLWADAAQGATDVALRAGMRTEILDTHNRLRSTVRAVCDLPQGRSHGAVIFSVHRERFADAIYELRARRYPFVLVDETLRDVSVPSVVADNYGGGYIVGEQLLRLGHRRIAFVGPLHSDTVRGRLDGLRDALADAHVPLGRRLVRSVPDELDQGRVPDNLSDEIVRLACGADSVIRDLRTSGLAEISRAVKELLSLSERPTAIFFYQDTPAAQACAILRSLGVRVPEDISVVGFDGTTMSQLVRPTLATARQPAYDMGVAAMEMLLDLMDGDPMARGSRMKAGVVNRAARTPVAARDGLEANGCADTLTSEHAQAVDGRRVAPMETEAPLAAVKESRTQPGIWHRVLPVTWQDGESIGPAPGAAGDFTTKDTKNAKATDGSRSPWQLNCAAKSAKDELENPGTMVAAK